MLAVVTIIHAVARGRHYVARHNGRKDDKCDDQAKGANTADAFPSLPSALNGFGREVESQQTVTTPSEDKATIMIHAALTHVQRAEDPERVRSENVSLALTQCSEDIEKVHSNVFATLMAKQRSEDS